MMKSTGIVRKVDDLGRIVLPKELRETMEIKEKDYLEIFTDHDQIVLKKYKSSCVFCDSVDDIILFKNRHICQKCKAELLK